MQNIHLRLETPEDKTFLQTLYTATRTEEVALFPWPPEQKNAFLTMQFELQYQHYQKIFPDAEFAIVMLDTTSVGRWYLHRGIEHFHLIDITLLPEYRCQGIGRYLLTKLLHEAQNANAKVSLHVIPNNPAIRLYQRLGFQIINTDNFYWQMEYATETEK